MVQQAPMPGAYYIALFNAQGQEVTRSGGTLFDLLASAGTVDSEGMSVVWSDGHSTRVLPLALAVQSELTETDKAGLVKLLKERAKSYNKLSEQVKGMEVQPDPEPVTPQQPIAPPPSPLG